MNYMEKMLKRNTLFLHAHHRNVHLAVMNINSFAASLTAQVVAHRTSN